MKALVYKIIAFKTWFSKHSMAINSNLLLLCCLLAGSFLAVTPALAQHPEVKQEKIKAVYLYNFLHFVTWPKSQERAKAERQITIGVLGDSSVKNALEELQTSLVGSGRTPISVNYYDKFSPEINFATCRILFVSDSEKKHFEEIINSLKGLPVLSVASSNIFLKQGGMIVLLENEGKIRYKINREAAKESGLSFNSQLLKSSL